MNILIAVALLALRAGSSPAAAQTPPTAPTPVLMWENISPSNVTGNFSWAHNLILDTTTLYAVGKTSGMFIVNSSTYYQYGLWAEGLAAAQGGTVSVSTSILSRPGGSYFGMEEMGLGLTGGNGLFGDNLLYSGRSVPNAILRATYAPGPIPPGPLFSMLITSANYNDGGYVDDGYAPPNRGLGNILLNSSDTTHGWEIEYAYSYLNLPNGQAQGFPELDFYYYRLAPTQPIGLSNYTAYRFNPVRDINSSWAGDCCYDPPKRSATDSKGYIYSLGGEIFDTGTGSYGFLIIKMNSGTGALTSWTYEGSATHGRSVADALLAAPDGSMIYVLAKTQESTGYGARVIAFDGTGNLLWLQNLATASGPIYDAAMAIGSQGLVVVEASTGKLLILNPTNGNILGAPLQLPFASGHSYYISAAVADASGNLYVSGDKDGNAWVANYNNLVQPTVPAAPGCSILTAYNYPNPFDSRAGGTTIHYQLYAAADAKIQIYNQLGAKVREWDFAQGSAGGMAGVNEFTWDGTTSSGRTALRGMYEARLTVTPDKCETNFNIGVQH